MKGGMKTWAEKSAAALRLALLALLLVAQASAFAHELGHFSSDESGICAVCSISGNAEPAATADQAVPQFGSGGAACLTGPTPGHNLLHVSNLSARGPPAAL